MFELQMHKKKYPRPVMGVLVGNKFISGLQKQIASSQIKLLINANKKVNITLYFFSLREVNLKEQKISGYFWHQKSKKWFQQDFSFPDILYIRCEINKGYMHTFKKLCATVTKSNGYLLTHSRFNKWRLYQIMSKDPLMKSYLPETRTYTQPDDIKKMLQDYKVIYLKSHIGKMGENVIRVEVLPHDSYCYSYYRDGRLTEIKTSSFQKLIAMVERFFQGREFLIQEAIQLVKVNGRLIDMRAEIQYNGDGILDIVGISVRQGLPASPITTHGDAFKLDDFMVKKMGYSKEQLKRFRAVVQKFLCNVYEYLENNYGTYAELGIDFAIDAKKNIWFIEANARSTKASLNKAYGKAVLYNNSKKLLEYAKYLYYRSK